MSYHINHLIQETLQLRSPQLKCHTGMAEQLWSGERAKTKLSLHIPVQMEKV